MAGMQSYSASTIVTGKSGYPAGIFAINNGAYSGGGSGGFSYWGPPFTWFTSIFLVVLGSLMGSCY